MRRPASRSRPALRAGRRRRSQGRARRRRKRLARGPSARPSRRRRSSPPVPDARPCRRSSQAPRIRATGHSSRRSSSTSSVRRACAGVSIAVPGDLAVALRGMPVACREERAVDRDRQVERRAGDELLAVDVPAPAPRRDRRVDARLGRRHAHDAEERLEVELAAQSAADPGPEIPVDGMVLAPVRDAPVRRAHLFDADDERLAGLRTPYLDRPGQRVAGVDLRVPRRDALVRLDVPCVVRRRDPDRVARDRRSAPARGRARSGRGAPTAPAAARGAPSAHPNGEVLVPRDEPVVVELDLRHEVARAVPHEPVAERLVPLLGSHDLESSAPRRTT